MAMMEYKATDDDLPAIFHEAEPRGINPVTVAKSRIHSAALAIGIEISPDELNLFAVLLIGLEED